MSLYVTNNATRQPGAFVASQAFEGYSSIPPLGAAFVVDTIVSQYYILTLNASSPVTWCDLQYADMPTPGYYAEAIDAVVSLDDGATFAADPPFSSIRLLAQKVVCSPTPSQTSTSPSATHTRSQTSMGFPVQAVIDNTGSTLSALTTAISAVGASATGGVVMHWPETDPVCGPGRYALSTLGLALLSPGGQSIVTFTLSLFLANETSLQPLGAPIATASVTQNVPTATAAYVLLALPSAFVVDTNVARAFLLAWRPSVELSWYATENFNGGVPTAGFAEPVAAVSALSVGAPFVDLGDYPGVLVSARKVACSPTPSYTTAIAPSQEGTATATATSSTSTTPTLTDTVSLTPTQEWTLSQFRTTPTQSQALTATQPGTPSLSARGTATASGSQLSTSPLAPSQSTSPRPISLAILLGNKALGSDSLPLQVSDAFPLHSLALELGSCPSSTVAAGVILLSCSATGLNSTLYADVVQSGPVLSPCSPSSNDPVTLPQTVSLGLYAMGGIPGQGLLTCEVSLGGASLARASVPVASSPALWPVWSDAIVVSAVGLMHSIVLGETVNVTSALVAAKYPDSGVSADVLASALASPRAVLDVARAVWGAHPLPPSSLDFSLTLVGQTFVVLRSLRRAFVAKTAATVGLVSATVLNTSGDGEWILLRMPSGADICDGVPANEDCGYFPLSLFNPTEGPSPAAYYPPITCPPFCPGALAAGVAPFVVSDPATGLHAVPATLPTGAALGIARPVPLDLPLLSSLGVYYARNCSAAGLWTDPATGACSNASDPRSFACAYGSGDACADCPAIALCPGGSREYPLGVGEEKKHGNGQSFPVSCDHSRRCLASPWGMGSLREGRACVGRLVPSSPGPLFGLECIRRYLTCALGLLLCVGSALLQHIHESSYLLDLRSAARATSRARINAWRATRASFSIQLASARRVRS